MPPKPVWGAPEGISELPLAVVLALPFFACAALEACEDVAPSFTRGCTSEPEPLEDPLTRGSEMLEGLSEGNASAGSEISAGVDEVDGTASRGREVPLSGSGRALDAGALLDGEFERAPRSGNETDGRDEGEVRAGREIPLSGRGRSTLGIAAFDGLVVDGSVVDAPGMVTVGTPTVGTPTVGSATPGDAGSVGTPRNGRDGMPTIGAVNPRDGLVAPEPGAATPVAGSERAPSEGSPTFSPINGSGSRLGNAAVGPVPDVDAPLAGNDGTASSGTEIAPSGI